MDLYDDDGKKFNQFEGKKSTYNEDIYTTKLDYSKVTTDLKKTASKMEKEIQAQDSMGNAHLAEERQQKQQHDIDETENYFNGNNHDEEMLYSGVERNEESKN